MANLGVNEGVDKKLAADSLTANSETAYRQWVVECYTSVTSDRKVVTTAGTAVALASSTSARKVEITAATDNTGYVVVGGSGVVAALATRKGTPLGPGDSMTVHIDNLASVYIDSTVSGDGVTFNYYV